LFLKLYLNNHASNSHLFHPFIYPFISFHLPFHLPFHLLYYTLSSSFVTHPTRSPPITPRSPPKRNWITGSKMDYRALSTLYYTKYYAADKASTLSSCPHAPIMLPLCPHYTKDYIETGLPPLIYPLLYQGTTNASTLSSCPHNSHYPPITPNLSAALYHQYRPRTTGIYYHVFLTLFL
jgi:hypothetical protein